MKTLENKMKKITLATFIELQEIFRHGACLRDENIKTVEKLFSTENWTFEDFCKILENQIEDYNLETDVENDQFSSGAKLYASFENGFHYYFGSDIVVHFQKGFDGALTLIAEYPTVIFRERYSFNAYLQASDLLTDMRVININEQNNMGSKPINIESKIRPKKRVRRRRRLEKEVN
jgi:hypothetical protein